MTNQKTVIKNWSAKLQEPQWLADRRLNAFEQYPILAYPQIERSSYLNWFDEEASKQVIFLDTVTDMYQLPQELIDQGVVVLPLSQAVYAYGELIKTHLMTQTITEMSDRMAALHLAYLMEGLFVYIPKHVKSKLPISLTIDQQISALNFHVLVIAEEDVQVNIIENDMSQLTTPHQANIMWEIYAGENSRITFSAIDNSPATSRRFTRRMGYLKRNAVIDWAIGAIGDGNAVLDNRCYLDAPGAQTDIKVVGVSHGNQEMDINSFTRNTAPHTQAHIFQHGAVLEASHINFNAIGIMEKGTKQADSQQESRLLMFSKEARGDANPILLINEYDLTAGHAASVGQIDQEQLYYLMSRGLSRQTAMRLAIRGFLAPVISAIPDADSKQQLITAIDRKLDAL